MFILCQIALGLVNLGNFFVMQVSPYHWPEPAGDSEKKQYTGKRSLNEYKNMHFSLHHKCVVRAIVSGLVTIFCVCVWGGGGGGGAERVSFAIGTPKYLMLESQNVCVRAPIFFN